MKIYISGKITGLNLDVARQLFAQAEDWLRGIGHEPVNPMKEVEQLSEDHWKKMMHDAIRVMMDCDGVYMLPNYSDSRGANIELYIANSLGMQVIYAGAE